MRDLFINVHCIIESTEDSIPPETTVEENNTQILSTSVQGKMIQSCVEVSQNVSEDFVQGQLSQGPRVFQTKTEELVVEQGHHFEKGDVDKFESKFKVAEENKVTAVENLPQDGIVQKMKLLERETSEDTKESIQKEEVAMSNLALACPHPFKVEKAAPVYGPEEDAEQKESFHPPELSSICTDDLPDLEDVESTVAFSSNQFSKIKILMYPEDEETY